MSHPSRMPTGTTTSRLSSTTTQLPASSSSTSASKSRQFSHLHAQLAQLTANLADLENLVEITAFQAKAMRELGGYTGAMFMASSRVLGEETIGAGAGGKQGEGEK